MKLGNIENLKNTLLIINQQELPFKLAYKFSKLTNKIEKDYQFYIERFKTIILKYAERDEKGDIVFEKDNVKIKPEQVPFAEKELADLNDIEIEEINIFFSLEELDALQMKPCELQGLLPFIKE